MFIYSNSGLMKPLEELCFFVCFWYFRRLILISRNLFNCCFSMMFVHFIRRRQKAQKTRVVSELARLAQLCLVRLLIEAMAQNLRVIKHKIGIKSVEVQQESEWNKNEKQEALVRDTEPVKRFAFQH